MYFTQNCIAPVLRGWYLRYCPLGNTKVPDGAEPGHPVHFGGPFGPSKMHWGVGFKVEPVNTKQTGLGPPHLVP